MKVLQLTAHFSPNMGGVETHLDDLVRGLSDHHHDVFVLTYRPLSVKAPWQIFQSDGKVNILRLPWIPGLFNKLAKIPAAEFLYLVPGLFLALPFILVLFRPDVIHAHGISSGLVAVVWGRLFGIRTILSTHSIYHFPSSGLYRWFSKSIFNTADFILCLSNQSVGEVVSLGVPSSKVGRFTYWIDLQKFKPRDKAASKKILKWNANFVVFFVGRLVSEKGIPELLESAKLFKRGVMLKIAGSGPMENEVKIFYVGRVSQHDLPTYYSAADLVIVPSTHEEGFGRVILESLACGTPVIGANRGAIPEAMNDSVGILIDISAENIAMAVNKLFSDKRLTAALARSSVSFAKERYSKSNIEQIVSKYHD